MNVINNLMKIKTVFTAVIISVVLITLNGCKNENKFMISKQKIGKLTIETKVMDLDEIFAKDSMVKKLSGTNPTNGYFEPEDEYIVYEKGGKHLLTIIPKKQSDSSSTIKSVQVFDRRYKTKSGIHLGANFQQVNANNEINRIETSLSSVVLFVDKLNATFTIDKKQLGLDDFSTQKVSLEQIPDLAQIKSLTIWFK